MDFCRRTRREFLWEAGAGFTGLALAGLLDQDGYFGATARAEAIQARAEAASASAFANPLAPKPPHFTPRAKSVIFLFMYGGPSHVDTFDYKPKLYELDGQTSRSRPSVAAARRARDASSGRSGSFSSTASAGKWVSDLFPNVATCVDDIAFLHSMTADSPIHGSAMLQMNTGKILSGSPCMGSWVNYGLGSVNQDLPGFVVMLDPTGGPISGAKNWSSGYMPATYQGTILRSAGVPVLDLKRPEADERGHAAQDPGQPSRLQHRARRHAIRQQQPRRPDRQLRDGVLDAAACPGSR